MFKTTNLRISEYLYYLATDRVEGILPSFLKACLWLLSLIYWVVIFVVSNARSCTPAVLRLKVISVGNITWGGTGKTPLVELLARVLKAEGRNVAILTRGYKRSACRKQGAATANASLMGDEPYMLSQKLQGVPVIVNSDRVKGGKQAQRLHAADTVILDDGLQQWGLQKDLEIVTIDVTNPFGNGCLIPRGILREPLSALRRADIFVLTNAGASTDLSSLRTRLANLNPSGFIVVARHKPSGFYRLGDLSRPCDIERIRANPAVLVSAIGNPDSFRQAVESLQISVAHTIVFPDHHRYSSADMSVIAKSAQARGIKTIITTEKDAGKLMSLVSGVHEPDIFVLKVSLEIIEHEEQFYCRLRSLYSA